MDLKPQSVTKYDLGNFQHFGDQVQKEQVHKLLGPAKITS